MPKKTLKRSRKQRRKTLRRFPKKGGEKFGPPPTAAFKNASPLNSDSVNSGIA